MPRHDRQPASLEIALDQLEVGPTDGAGDDLQHQLIRSRLGIDQLDESEGCRARGTGRAKLESEHRTTVPQIVRRPSGTEVSRPGRDDRVARGPTARERAAPPRITALAHGAPFDVTLSYNVSTVLWGTLRVWDVSEAWQAVAARDYPVHLRPVP